MTIIGVMDGASGSIREKKYRTRRYMSNTVCEVIQELHMSHFEYFEGKGGIWSYWDRKLMKFIFQHNRPGNKLVLIGKSYGGRDVKDALNRLVKVGSHYDKVRALFVDAEWISRDTNDPLVVPRIDKIINVFQRNTSVLCGAKVVSPTEDIIQHIITDDDIDHFNIVGHPFVRDSVRNIIAG